MGCSPPPPSPCSTRNKRRRPRLGAIPHSKELNVKKAIHAMKNRLRPTTPAIHPLIGKTMAFDTRYEVRTHVLSSLLTPRLPAMYGRATLAMLVSRISMNAAIATTLAIIHGLRPPLTADTPWGRRSRPAGVEDHCSVPAQGRFLPEPFARF